VGTVVHVLPWASTLIACAVALVVSLALTWHDLQWMQGAGRHDGQAALAWVDPPGYVVMVFAVALGLALLPGALRKTVETIRAARSAL